MVAQTQRATWGGSLRALICGAEAAESAASELFSKLMGETNTNANIQVEEIRHHPLGHGLTALMVTPLDGALPSGSD